MKLLVYVAIVGDVLYILFLLYNAIDEGFQGIGRVQGLAPLGLILVLLLNIALLLRSK